MKIYLVCSALQTVMSAHMEMGKLHATHVLKITLKLRGLTALNVTTTVMSANLLLAARHVTQDISKLVIYAKVSLERSFRLWRK